MDEGWQKVLVIPDIHGYSSLLDAALRDHPEHKVIFLGDYIDRGPDSHGVLDTVKRLVESGQAIALRGNHDQMMIDAVLHGNADAEEDWLDNGGQLTFQQLKREGCRWWASWMDRHLVHWHIHEGILFAHAARPRTLDFPPHNDQHLWHRPRWKDPIYGSGLSPLPEGIKLSIHGHSITNGMPIYDSEHLALYIDCGVFRNALCVLDLDGNAVKLYGTDQTYLPMQAFSNPPGILNPLALTYGYKQVGEHQTPALKGHL